MKHLIARAKRAPALGALALGTFAIGALAVGPLAVASTASAHPRVRPIRAGKPERQTLRLTVTDARHLTRQYLADPLVSRIRVPNCQAQAWEGSRTIRCHVSWQQRGLFSQPADVHAWVRVRVWDRRPQCNLVDGPWGACRNAKPFAIFGA
jgi:hypothetical protein